MNILLTGGTGLLGKSLIDTKGGNINIVSAYNGDYCVSQDEPDIKYLKIDILDKNKYLNLGMSFKPEYLIHCASIGSPDYADKNRDHTWAINVDGTANMAELCNITGAKMIYISSNGIYDGNNPPYFEESEAVPINFYGQTKLEGEKLARTAFHGCIIVRPILMYGWNNTFERNNIVTMTLGKLSSNERVYAYDDVYANPLYSIQCANAIWKIIEMNLTGDFNIAGADRVSICDLLRIAAKVFGKDPELISPVQQGYFNELVKRPRDTSFSTDKMENILGIKPLTLEQGLSLMKASIPSNN